jgi:hypothetical protein
VDVGPQAHKRPCLLPNVPARARLAEEAFSGGRSLGFILSDTRMPGAAERGPPPRLFENRARPICRTINSIARSRCRRSSGSSGSPIASSAAAAAPRARAARTGWSRAAYAAPSASRPHATLLTSFRRRLPRCRFLRTSCWSGWWTTICSPGLCGPFTADVAGIRGCLRELPATSGGICAGWPVVGVANRPEAALSQQHCLGFSVA